MPSRANNSGIRFGRFTVSGTVTLPIIAGRSGLSVYRILNSGKQSFNVTPRKSGMADVDLPVAPKCALDFFVNTDPVKIKTTGGKNAGIYDDVRLSFADLRPGRFEFAGEATPQYHPLIDLTGRSGTPHLVYRVYNSGDNSIIITGGGLTDQEIVSAQSVDIELGDSGTVGVKGAANQAITGIFELLNQI